MRSLVHFLLFAITLMVCPSRLPAAQDPENLTTENHAPIQAEAVSPDGRYKAITFQGPGEESQVILMHDLAYERHGGLSAIRILAHSAPVLSIAFSLDNRRMATGAADGKLRLWSLNTGGSARLLAEIQAHDQGITSLSFDSGGRLLESRATNSQSRFWDIHKDMLLPGTTSVLSAR